MTNPDRTFFKKVEKDEFQIIQKLRNLNKNPENRVGLAFSGGGIRSATFGLGVLEALKDKDLLKKVDYLSTVSGGGYIGAWLSANCKRTADRIEKQKSDKTQKVEPSWLHPDADWTESIKHLRRYSNYLSPNLSLLSADTWSMVTIWLRNTLLLQLMIIMGIAGVLLLPRLLWPVIEFEINAYLSIPILLIFVILVYWIAENLKRLKFDKESKTYKSHTLLGKCISQKMVQIFVGIFLLVSLGVSVVLWQLAEKDQPFVDCIGKLFSIENYTWVFLVISYAAFVLFSYCSTPTRDFRIRHLLLAAFSATVLLLLLTATLYLIGDWKSFEEKSGSVLAFAWAPPMVAAAFSLAINVLIGMQGIDSYESIREWWSRFGAWLAIYGFAWMLVVTIAFYGPLWSEMLYYEGSWKTLGSGWIGTTLAGLLAGKSASTSGTDNNGVSTKLKEILAKAAPFVFIAGLVIAVSLVLHLVIVINTTDEKLSQSTLLGNKVYDGKQIALQFDKTDGKDNSTLPECVDASKPSPLCPKYGELKAKTNYLTKDIHFDLGTLQELKDIPTPQYPNHWKLLAKAKAYSESYGKDWPKFVVFWLLIVTPLCLWVLSWRIDINEFSLNAFYRNRLARCYLGATRQPKERKPHEFTGFDDGDDLNLSELLCWEDDKGNPCKPYPVGPFHIVNCALNLGGSSDLSLHTRHSAIFTLTPLYSGSLYIKRNQSGEPEEKMPNGDPVEIGYHPTFRFGGVKNQPTLGQAIAVSGAAASPNMGYHTSAPVSFLMTLFNSRLGWWFPNPSLSDCKKPSPLNSLKFLLCELFGIANEKSEFSAISDGGHFENLAAYELIKRRCSVIIISDGECDPKLQFEGLATLIRMCEVDNLVNKIDIDVRSIHPESEAGWSRNRCAVGEITYKDNSKGWLIYLKASMNGYEDTAVMQYKAAHPDFPHETTGDQFYAEDQFESYRSLGRDIAENLFSKVFTVDNNGNPIFIDSVGKVLDEKGKPVEVGTEEYMVAIAKALSTIFSPMLPSQAQFTKHADRLMEIWNQLSKNPDLKSLDSELCPSWSSGNPDRSVFYLCSEMIQLMENVYLDLNLEATWKHDDNKGWLELFKKWAKSPQLEATWKLTYKTYSERFQSFWDRNLK